MCIRDRRCGASPCVGQLAVAHGIHDHAAVSYTHLDVYKRQIYHHAHTHRWRDLVTSADAIVWVMPEYNNGYPARIKYAIDYLYAWL